MNHLNIEIKARSNNHEKVREILKSHDADFKGIDHQIDTYFNVPNGRLKLREGNIETGLVQYQRENIKGSKQSDVVVYWTEPGSALKEALTNTLGILTVVDKKREIYFIDNVKFHIDVVKDLGLFVEIEAIATDKDIPTEKLKEQCDEYISLLDISEKDLISVSYSDLLLKK